MLDPQLRTWRFVFGTGPTAYTTDITTTRDPEYFARNAMYRAGYRQVSWHDPADAVDTGDGITIPSEFTIMTRG